MQQPQLLIYQKEKNTPEECLTYWKSTTTGNKVIFLLYKLISEQMMTWLDNHKSNFYYLKDCS